MTVSQRTVILSASVGYLGSRAVAYLLSTVTKIGFHKAVVWISWILFIPGILINAMSYTGTTREGYYGVHNNASLGTFHAGRTWESTGNPNAGLFDGNLTRFGLASLLLYGGGFAVLLILFGL